jgi:hypothetical protein
MIGNNLGLRDSSSAQVLFFSLQFSFIIRGSLDIISPCGDTS